MPAATVSCETESVPGKSHLSVCLSVLELLQQFWQPHPVRGLRLLAEIKPSGPSRKTSGHSRPRHLHGRAPLWPHRNPTCDPTVQSGTPPSQRGTPAAASLDHRAYISGLATGPCSPKFPPNCLGIRVQSLLLGGYL